jgi:hypothetical protein
MRFTALLVVSSNSRRAPSKRDGTAVPQMIDQCGIAGVDDGIVEGRVVRTIIGWTQV